MATPRSVTKNTSARRVAGTSAVIVARAAIPANAEPSSRSAVSVGDNHSSTVCGSGTSWNVVIAIASNNISTRGDNRSKTRRDFTRGRSASATATATAACANRGAPPTAKIAIAIATSPTFADSDSRPVAMLVGAFGYEHFVTGHHRKVRPFSFRDQLDRNFVCIFVRSEHSRDAHQVLSREWRETSTLCNRFDDRHAGSELDRAAAGDLAEHRALERIDL